MAMIISQTNKMVRLVQRDLTSYELTKKIMSHDYEHLTTYGFWSPIFTDRDFAGVTVQG